MSRKKLSETRLSDTVILASYLLFKVLRVFRKSRHYLFVYLRLISRGMSDYTAPIKHVFAR